MTMPDAGNVYMDQHIKAYGIKVSLLYVDLEPVGFTVYHIEPLDNPWWLHEGTGNIRRFYNKPRYRNLKLGAFLSNYVKTYFRKQGVKTLSEL